MLLYWVKLFWIMLGLVKNSDYVNYHHALGEYVVMLLGLWTESFHFCSSLTTDT